MAWSGTLTAPIAAEDTIISVSPAFSTSHWGRLLIIDAAGTPSLVLVRGSADGGRTLYVDRGVLGSEASSYPAGTTISQWGAATNSGSGQQGPPGEKGDKGDKGDPGDAGPPGDPGPPGQDGAPGADGLQGEQGLQGLPGDKGDTGDQGPRGLQGDPGLRGIQGVPGADSIVPGPPGDTGLKGDKGDKGDQGIQGLTGQDGATGPAGTTLHANLSDVSANQHHAQLHASAHASGQGDPLTPAAIGASATGHTHSSSEAFPVGSVFLAVVSTNPATLLGYGTWAAFGAGRMLIGNDGATYGTDEATGGASTHTHSAHSDVINHTHAVNVTDPQHAHAMQRFPTATGGSTGFTVDTSMSGTQANANNTANASTGISATTDNPAGGMAALSHDSPSHLNPYIVVHMWKRTA